MDVTLRSLLQEALDIIGDDHPADFGHATTSGWDSLIRPCDDRLPTRHLDFMIRARRALSECQENET
jgi:hypothetical protein